MLKKNRGDLKMAHGNKIYICDGMDRCGKDSVIKLLRKQITNTRLVSMHCDAPPVCDDVDLWSRQHYAALLTECRRLWNDGFDVILNRSHIGEFVYGNLYRKSDPEWVFDLHKHVLLSHWQQDFYFDNVAPRIKTLIVVDNGENIIKRDDGLSLATSVDSFNKEYRRWNLCAARLAEIDPNTTLIDWAMSPFSEDALKQIVTDLRGTNQ